MPKIIIDQNIINDLPIGRLSDKNFRRALQLLVIADDKGCLPNIKDITWLIRETKESDIEKSIKELYNCEFLEIYYTIFPDSNKCNYRIKNFEKYHVSECDAASRDASQKSSRKLSDAERAKNYRERKKASRDLSDETSQNLSDETSHEPSRDDVEFSKENSDKLNNNINNINNFYNDKVYPSEFTTVNSKEENNINNINNSVTQKSDEASQPSRDERDENPENEKYKWAREEAERARLFSEHTNLSPLKNEYGRWIKELRQFTEAGISNELMIAAINQMRMNNLRIKAPGSVIAVARDMAATTTTEAPLSYDEIAFWDEEDWNE